MEMAAFIDRAASSGYLFNISKVLRTGTPPYKAQK